MCRHHSSMFETVCALAAVYLLVTLFVKILL